MCIHLTLVHYCITTVLIEVYLLCSTESVSLRDIGKSTLSAEISSPSSLYIKAVKIDHIGPDLTGGIHHPQLPLCPAPLPQNESPGPHQLMPSMC